MFHFKVTYYSMSAKISSDDKNTRHQQLVDLYFRFELLRSGTKPPLTTDEKNGARYMACLVCTVLLLTLSFSVQDYLKTLASTIGHSFDILRGFSPIVHMYDGNASTSSSGRLWALSRKRRTVCYPRPLELQALLPTTDALHHRNPPQTPNRNNHPADDSLPSPILSLPPFGLKPTPY